MPALGTIWNNLFGMCPQRIGQGRPLPGFPLPAVPVSVVFLFGVRFGLVLLACDWAVLILNLQWCN